MSYLTKVLLVVGVGLLGLATVMVMATPISWMHYLVLFVGGYLTSFGLFARYMSHRRTRRTRQLELQDGSVLGCGSPRVLYESADFSRYAELAKDYFRDEERRQ